MAREAGEEKAWDTIDSDQDSHSRAVITSSSFWHAGAALKKSSNVMSAVSCVLAKRKRNLRQRAATTICISDMEKC